MGEIQIISNAFSIPDSTQDKPYLIGARCTVCGYVSFLRKNVCIKCLKDDTIKEVRLGPYGILEIFAVMQAAPTG